MIGWPRWRFLALAVYLGSAIAQAPSSFLAWALSHYTDGEISIEGAAGTAWRGTAAAVAILDGSGTARRVEDLQWEWLAERVPAGEFALRIQVHSASLRGTAQFALRLTGVRISYVAFDMPASALALYIPELSSAGLSGYLSLRSDEFTLDRNALRGKAAIQWRDASSSLTKVGLGEYRALVTGSGTDAEFAVETLGGPLKIDGRGTWSRRNGLVFEAIARTDPRQSQDLLGVARFLGADLGNGTHRLQLRVPRLVFSSRTTQANVKRPQ